MKKFLLVVVTTVAALLALVSPARAGGAGYYPVEDRDHVHHADLWVARTATLKHAGFRVVWRVKIVCPAGRTYTLDDATLGNLNPASVPPLTDGDGWIYAALRRPVTGTCSGTVQKVRLRLVTQRARWADTYVDGVFYPAGSCRCPLVADDQAETNVRLSGDGFDALYAVNVGADRTASHHVALVERHGGDGPGCRTR